MTVTNRVGYAPPCHEAAISDRHRADMMESPVAPTDSSAVIAIRCDSPGVVLSVRGSLDSSACELLREVVRAALVAVGRAARIHLDLSRVRPVPERLPRIVRQLERAGAVVTSPNRGPYGTPFGVARTL